MMKRWSLLILVLSLALSVTTCSKRPTQNYVDYGYGLCDDPSLGQFDVYLVPDPGNTSLYNLEIVPINLDAPGDIVSVTVANNNLSYKTMVNEVVLQPGENIYAGSLTQVDLQTYNLLAITPYQPGASFLEGSADKASICDLPQPNITNGTTYGN